MVRIYGKEECGKCEAAKEKLTRLGVEYEFVYADEIMTPYHWMIDPQEAREVQAIYSQTDTLPIIRIDDTYHTYPEAMAALKKRGKS